MNLLPLFSLRARLLGLALAAAFVAPAAHTFAAQFEVTETTVADIHAAFAAKKLTARQLVQLYLDRIAAYDQQGPKINCVITINPDALADADKLDAAYAESGPVGPLHGIPILVKDEIDTAGMPTTLGTLVFKDYRPPLDSFPIARLRKAGAIILGKTTLSEFAGGDTYGSMFGISRNPYALDRTVGGSSGGTGGALAANFATLGVGEETFASLRRPASWNSLTGLRPTPGLVSRSGMWDGHPVPTAQMGPMTRTVTDLAKMMDVMVGYDPEDPITAIGVAHTPKTYTAFLDKNGLKGARIGVIREPIGAGTDPTAADFKMINEAFEKNLAELRAAGAILIDNIAIPDLKALMSKRVMGSRGDDTMAIYLARNPHSPFKTREDIANHPDMVKAYPPNKLEAWKNPRPPAPPAQVLEAINARETLALNFAKVIGDNRLDALVHKSVEHAPTLIKDGINPPYVGPRGIASINTFIIHSSTITIPSGFTADNLPVGITFLGLPFSEPTMIKLAYAYEQATHHRRPPATTPSLTGKK